MVISSGETKLDLKSQVLRRKGSEETKGLVGGLDTGCTASDFVEVNSGNVDSFRRGGVQPNYFAYT